MKAKSDCAVSFAPGGGKLRLRVASSVGGLFGRAIEAAARGAAAELGAETGELLIEDDGALDYVVAARTEAALRAAGYAARYAAAVPGGAAAAGGPAAVGGPAAASPDRRDMRLRSRLYLPGNQPDLLPNSGLFGSDCLVLDLEDSVPPARKAEARILARRVLESSRAFFGNSVIAVRVNPLTGSWGAADIEEMSLCLPRAILLPKCEEASDIEELGAALDRIEAKRGSEHGLTRIIPLVETARGILAAASIAASSPRVVALCFGAEDFTRDIGAAKTAAGTETLFARQAIVLAAKAAGVQALDSVFSDVDDIEGFSAYCAASRAMGFDGVGLLHPRQIAIAHRAFSPSREEIEEALRIVAAFDAALAEGSGVVSLDGRMIDAPVAARARRIAAAAGVDATEGR